MTALALKLHPDADMFAEDFARNRAELPGARLAWLDARRAQAMEAFAKTGIPTRRVEAWKFTDLANALESGLEQATRFQGAIPDANLFGSIEGARIVVVNGFPHRVEQPDGIETIALSKLSVKTPDWVKDHLGLTAAGADQPLGAASLALMRDGVAIKVKKSSALNLVFVTPNRGQALVAHTRVLVVVEEGVSLRLLESHQGEGAEQTLANIGVELVLKQGARIEHMRVQAEAPAALHVTSLGVTLARDAEYRALYATVGARLSRLDVNLRLDAPGARATLHHVAVLNSGVVDITTVMNHAAPHTVSRQLFKSVVGGRGRSVNQGRVIVHEGAVKSDSHQLFKALLLSDRAEADAKPELEIFADDVICGHGTAIGALDQDALFYLRARGIPEEEARGLLVRAFLDEAIEGFAEGAVRDGLWRRLDVNLASLGQEP
jgi:Fe-S cluster assembly protein SufD